uniref:Uncharacterized protein n=1 Tax=Rhizophora mucronata TaxID=61149 RepID=A0A2P2PCN7_RHIMU
MFKTALAVLEVGFPEERRNINFHFVPSCNNASNKLKQANGVILNQA